MPVMISLGTIQNMARSSISALSGLRYTAIIAWALRADICETESTVDAFDMSKLKIGE